jgi:hypothetical protein
MSSNDFYALLRDAGNRKCFSKDFVKALTLEFHQVPFDRRDKYLDTLQQQYQLPPWRRRRGWFSVFERLHDRVFCCCSPRATSRSAFAEKHFLDRRKILEEHSETKWCSRFTTCYLLLGLLFGLLILFEPVATKHYELEPKAPVNVVAPDISKPKEPWAAQKEWDDVITKTCTAEGFFDVPVGAPGNMHEPALRKMRIPTFSIAWLTWPLISLIAVALVERLFQFLREKRARHLALADLLDSDKEGNQLGDSKAKAEAKPKGKAEQRSEQPVAKKATAKPVARPKEAPQPKPMQSPGKVMQKEHAPHVKTSDAKQAAEKPDARVCVQKGPRAKAAPQPKVAQSPEQPKVAQSPEQPLSKDQASLGNTSDVEQADAHLAKNEEVPDRNDEDIIIKCFPQAESVLLGDVQKILSVTSTKKASSMPKPKRQRHARSDAEVVHSESVWLKEGILPAVSPVAQEAASETRAPLTALSLQPPEATKKSPVNEMEVQTDASFSSRWQAQCGDIVVAVAEFVVSGDAGYLLLRPGMRILVQYVGSPEKEQEAGYLYGTQLGLGLHNGSGWFPSWVITSVWDFTMPRGLGRSDVDAVDPNRGTCRGDPETLDVDCAICMARRRNCLVLPCSHMPVCSECWDTVRTLAGVANQDPRCPLCRSVVGVVHTVKW